MYDITPLKVNITSSRQRKFLKQKYFDLAGGTTMRVAFHSLCLCVVIVILLVFLCSFMMFS